MQYDKCPVVLKSIRLHNKEIINLSTTMVHDLPAIPISEVDALRLDADIRVDRQIDRVDEDRLEGRRPWRARMHALGRARHKIGRARQGTRIVLRVGVLVDLVRALLRRLRRALLPQVGHVPPRDPAADRNDAWHEDKGEDAGDEAAVVADVLAEALGRREDDEGVGVEEWLCGYYCGGGGRRAGRR